MMGGNHLSTSPSPTLNSQITSVITKAFSLYEQILLEKPIFLTELTHACERGGLNVSGDALKEYAKDHGVLLKSPGRSESGQVGEKPSKKKKLRR